MHPTYVASNETKPEGGCMVYTERAPRWQQFHVAPATQQIKHTVSHFGGCSNKCTIVKLQSRATTAQCVCSESENSALLKNMLQDYYFKCFRCSVAYIVGRFLESFFVSRPRDRPHRTMILHLSPSLSVNVVT